MNLAYKLALGTAQMGLAYGIANSTGKVSEQEISAILHAAASAGMDTLDTAIAYGDSETRLGQAGVAGWKVVSKLPALPEAEISPEFWVHHQVEQSCQRLRVSSLYGFLLHCPHQVLESRGSLLLKALLEEKERGRILKIGVSVYHPSDLESIWPVFQPDLVQLPLNVFDQRMITSGWLDRLHCAAVEVHARSVFLQGLLLLPPARLPAWCQTWSQAFSLWHQWTSRLEITPLQAALSFALQQPQLARVVVGIDHISHCRELIEIAKDMLTRQIHPAHFEQLAQNDENLINPTLWPIQS